MDLLMQELSATTWPRTAAANSQTAGALCEQVTDRDARAGRDWLHATVEMKEVDSRIRFAYHLLPRPV